MLVGLAAWIPFRHRGEGASGPVRRWAIRVLSVPAFALAVIFFFMPVGMAVVDIHSMPRAIGSPPDAAYQTVSFTASDGVDLEGWYRPSENGASVLMISGGGGNRRSTLRHAKMLVRHGYGVLVYDPRGSGNSEGTVNSYGWGWEKDAAAALDFLAERDDVEPGRVGALGSPPAPTSRSTSPPAATSRPWSPEKEWGELYDRAGGARSELWYLPKASHTAALKQYPEAYEQRVASFFDENLRAN